MSIKRLAGQTAIYGLSSILGRLLYFFLTPIYSRVFETADYGVVTDLFSFIGLAMIFFTYRMETAYFRFATDEDPSKSKPAYDTALLSIVGTSLLFGLAIAFMSGQLAIWFKYPEYANLIIIAGAILALDSLAEIPLSYLRLTHRATKFASIRLVGIAINIGFNLFFILLCPYLAQEGYTWIYSVYRPDFGIGYIFLSNLVASIFVLLLLLPYYFRVQFQFDPHLWRRMIVYALPLILVGISYSINELLDRKIMISLLPGTVAENKSILGSYGACYKLTMILALFTQAFRYGAEPFFFQQRSTKGAQSTYAQVMKYYALFALVGCLFTLLYLDVIKYILSPDYWLAIGVIPLLLLANLMNGLYYNVSIWYRLTDKTLSGAWIALIGAGITIVLNLWWLPIFGFWGSAWATLICYVVMLWICHSWGTRVYPVPYDWKTIGFYFVVAAFLYGISLLWSSPLDAFSWTNLFFHTLLFCLYIGFLLWREKEVVLPIWSQLRRKIF
jgi:O-antigen/teichoic acid export membrane protein